MYVVVTNTNKSNSCATQRFYKTISNYNYLSQSFHHTLVLANKTLIYHLQLAISSFQVAYDTQYHETAGLTSYYT